MAKNNGKYSERGLIEALDGLDISLADKLLDGADVNVLPDEEMTARVKKRTLARILPDCAVPLDADIIGNEKGTINMTASKKKLSRAAIALIAAATAVTIGTVSVGAANNWDYSRVFGALFGGNTAVESTSMLPEVTELSNTFENISVSIDGIAGDSNVLYVIATLTKTDGTAFDGDFYYVNHGWQLDGCMPDIAPVSIWLDEERSTDEIKFAFCCNEPYDSFAGKKLTFDIVNIFDSRGELVSEGEWSGSFTVGLDANRAEYELEGGAVSKIILSQYAVQAYTAGVNKRLTVTMTDGTVCGRYNLCSRVSNGDNSMIFYSFREPVSVAEVRSVQVGEELYTLNADGSYTIENAPLDIVTPEAIAEVTAVVYDSPEETGGATGLLGADTENVRYFPLGYDKNGNAPIVTSDGNNGKTVLLDDNANVSLWEKESPAYHSGEELILDKLTRVLDNGYCELVCVQHGEWLKNEYLEELDTWTYDYVPDEEKPDEYKLKVHTFTVDNREFLTVQTADGSTERAYNMIENGEEYDVTDILSGDVYYAYRFIGAAVNDDMTKIAYTDGFMNNAIYISDLDGNGKKQIFSDESLLITDLAYTGGRIAFNGTVGDRHYLCVINEDGKGFEKAEYTSEYAPQICKGGFLWSIKSGAAVIYDGTFRELAAGGTAYAAENADVFAAVTQGEENITVTIYSTKTGDALKSILIEADEDTFVTDIAVGNGELLASVNHGSSAELMRFEF